MALALDKREDFSHRNNVRIYRIQAYCSTKGVELRSTVFEEEQT
jgi:hypothetical protein